jgi:hypothetical protein
MPIGRGSLHHISTADKTPGETAVACLARPGPPLAGVVHGRDDVGQDELAPQREARQRQAQLRGDPVLQAARLDGLGLREEVSDGFVVDLGGPQQQIDARPSVPILIPQIGRQLDAEPPGRLGLGSPLLVPGLPQASAQSLGSFPRHVSPLDSSGPSGPTAHFADSVPRINPARDAGSYLVARQSCYRANSPTSLLTAR